MADEIVYEDTIGSLETSREQLEESRDDAMDWMDEYYQPPEQASLVSENLDELLDPTSAYMKAAQDESEKARSKQGYLDSGFNRGAGTVAAIDSAFDVALEDAYVDVFNTNQYNIQYRDDYLAAYEIAMKAMATQDQQSFGEYGYSLIIASMEETQDDLLELKDKEYEYADLLQTSKHDDNMDMLHLKHANDLANRILRNTSGLQGYYLESFTGIIGSDISQRDKYDQLLGLGYQIDKATTAATNQQYTNVGDNPYGISYVDTLPQYEIGERTDEAFVWSVNDAVFEYQDVWKLLNDLRSDIYEQTNHAERDMSSLWTVLNDKVFVELRSIDKDSQLFIDKMEYYNRTKYDVLGSDPTNDEIEKFFLDMYNIGKTIGRPVYSGEEYGYYEPYTVTSYTWDSESESIIETKTQMPGSSSYYADQYARYDSDEMGFMAKPTGYDAARAACKWPDEWSRGRCITPGG